MIFFAPSPHPSTTVDKDDAPPQIQEPLLNDTCTNDLITYRTCISPLHHNWHTRDLLSQISTNLWTPRSGQGLVSMKAPTCALFTPSGVFDSFGFEAEDKYIKMAENGNHENWYFFRRFKMLLYENKVPISLTVIT